MYYYNLLNILTWIFSVGIGMESFTGIELLNPVI